MSGEDEDLSPGEWSKGDEPLWINFVRCKVKYITEV